MSGEEREGLVVRVSGTGYEVRLHGGRPEGNPVHAVCCLRGNLRKELRDDGREKVVVGDDVLLTLAPDGTGVIERLLPRRSVLVRRAAGGALRDQVTAANIDRIAVVVSCKRPAWKAGFIDRVLCAAERTQLPAMLVMNKVDLLDAAERGDLRDTLLPYPPVGVEVLETSVVTGEGVAAFRGALLGRRTVVTGPSGVGKSSLLNAVSPGLGLAIGAVSDSTTKGRHTTTGASMHPFEGDSFVVDTPGVRAFGFFDLEVSELGYLYKEIRPFAYWDGDAERPRCRFRDCLHRGEKGCEVLRAVERGELPRARYESYLRLLQSVEEERG